ncbi:iron chaperone [Bifidobacterium aquikefiri]|uniref:iron chaperone n=1 Tax=Bifidobacterium aquikefiri TaxID=1653207 RepID=UPI0039EB14C5
MTPTALPPITDPIGDYIAAQSVDMQPRLYEVYQAIASALPDATEKMAYGIPTFWQGRNLIHFAAFTRHIGIYPGSKAIEAFNDRLTEYKTSKGTIQIPNDKPLPLGLIKELAQWSKEHNAR